MKTIAKKTVARSTKFVVRHKVAIAVTTTSAFWIWVNRTALKEHDNFLKEHELYDAFYTPEV